MARPRKEIDEEKLRQLASLGLSNAEIAAVLECSHDTIERNYADVLQEGRFRRNASLRRKQYEVAMGGHPTMLIWLGKQHLGQREVVEGNDSANRLDDLISAMNSGPVERGKVNEE